MTVNISDRLVKTLSGEIDADLLRVDGAAFAANANKQLTLQPRPTATSTTQGEMSAAQAAKLDTLSPLTSDAIATALDGAGVNWRGDGVTVSELGTATQVNGGTIYHYDLGEAIDANAQYMMIFPETANSVNVAPAIPGWMLLSDTYAPAQAATPADKTGALSFKIDRPADAATVNTTNFGHATCAIWRSSTANHVYLYTTHGASDVTVRILKITGSGGGTTGTSNAATWARTGNTDAIPGAKLTPKVIANAQASVAGFAVGTLVFNLDDKHFYRVLEDTTHAARPLRITFAADSEIASDGTELITYGYARAAITTYATQANGTLALAPNVQATLPGTLDAILSVSHDDFSAGSIFIGIDAASTFVPARFKYRVLGGGPEHEYAIGYDGGTTGTVHRYFTSSHFDPAQGNPWGITEGDTDTITVDFDILDASGASIAPATTARRYLQRIDLPGTVTGFDGDTNVVYGSHSAPEAQSGLLVDTVTGDEYFAKRSNDADLVIVEPVRAGTSYGLAPGNKASFNNPSTLTRLTWDNDTGLVDVEASTGAALNGWKKIAHIGDPADTQGSTTRSARLIEIPAANTELGTRRKRALMADWHSGLVRLSAADNSDGNPAITVDGGGIEFTVDSTRKLAVTLDAPYSSRDDGQVIGFQRITPELSNNIHWRAGIQESASDDGTVPDSGVWGTLGGGLHPVWFEFSLRATGTVDEQRAASYLHAGYRVESDEALWMVFYYNSNLTDTFHAKDTTGVQAVKMVYDPEVVTTGSVQRHKYTIASDTPENVSSFFSVATAEMPWYIGLVITPSSATNITGFTRSLEPVNYDAVEIEGVPIPLTITSRKMVVPTGSTIPDAQVDSHLQTDYETAAWGSGQEVPLTAGTDYAINFKNARNVRGRPYLSATHPPSKHDPSAFRLLDSSDAATMTTNSARAWWEVRSRGLPTTNAPPQEQGDPWRLRRWNNEEHRAVPSETDDDIQGYAVAHPTVDDALEIMNWSRTVLRQLVNNGGSLVIGRVTASAETNGNRTLFINAATAGPLTTAHIRIINRTQDWTLDSRDVSPFNTTRWRVILDAGQYPLAEGDEIRLRIRAVSAFNPEGHTPIAWDHSVTVWEDV